MDDGLPDDVAAELWHRGELSYKLRPHQRDLYGLLNGLATRTAFIDCARRFGKSFTALLWCVEQGLRRELLVRFAAPTQKDLEEIYHPIMETICEDAPEELCPVWRTTKGRGHYFFPSTGSKLYMFGTDARNYKKGRGKATDIAIFDEVGAADNAKHVVKSIFLPQTFGRNGRVVMLTTPPETPGHESTELKVEAELAGSYFRRTVYDNTHAKPEDIEEYARESGGKDSTTFRREYLCEWVVEETRAVVPEFGSRERAIVRVPEVPPYFDAIEAMDVGGNDFTAVLFGYWDFLAAKLVVVDEIVMRLNAAGRTTDKLAELVKAKEQEHFAGKPVFGRWSDTDVIFLNDLSVVHGLHFIPTLKDDKEAQVAELRRLVQAEKLIIHPRCTHTVAQMRAAVWNKQRTSFERTEVMGHFDAVDALIYLARNAPRHADPYPKLAAGVATHSHFIPPSVGGNSEAATLVGAMFKRRR